MLQKYENECEKIKIFKQICLLSIHSKNSATEIDQKFVDCLVSYVAWTEK